MHMLETFDQSRSESNALQSTTAQLRSDIAGVMVDSIHFGLVEMGGFLVSVNSRRISGDICIITIVCPRMREITCLKDHGPAEVHASGETQNQGVAAGQDTDETAEDAESEENAEANDPAIGADEDGPYETLVRSLRNEINLALQRGHIGDAADLQGIVMFVLDSAHAGNLREANSSRDNVIQEICFRIES